MNPVGVLRKVISGGQTGVDQAALRAAQACGIATGGWCPPGRACEAGVIPADLPLVETPEDRSPNAPHIPRSLRTEWNVRDSEATLVLRRAFEGEPDPGTVWSIQCVERFGRHVHVCDPAEQGASSIVLAWLASRSIQVLNVAGPSEALQPGIGVEVEAVLRLVFSLALDHGPEPG